MANAKCESKKRKNFSSSFSTSVQQLRNLSKRDLCASQLNVVQDGECVNPVKFLYKTDKKKNACSKVTFLLRA